MIIDTDIDEGRDFDASEHEAPESGPDENGSPESGSPESGSDENESDDAHLGETDADPEAKPETQSESEPNADQKAPRRGASLGTVFVFSGLAALIGGGVGAFAPRYLDPANAAPASAISRNSASLTSLNAQVSQQQNSVSNIEADLAAANNTLGNISRLSARLQSIEQAVEAQAQIDISAQRAAALTPLSNKIDAMETLMATEDMPEGAPSALLSRLEGLEGQIEELRVSLATLPPSAILSYRVGPETREGIRPANERPAEEIDPAGQGFDLIANFPREQMLAVLQTQKETAANPTWLRRFFSQHVQVRDANELDPRGIIDNAETLIHIGDIRGAINALESLNPSLRAAAQPWIVQAEKTL